MYYYCPFAICFSLFNAFTSHWHTVHAHDSFKMLLADSVNGNSRRQQISLQWLKTRSDFSNTEPSSILHCNVLVSAHIIMNYSSSTSCNTIRVMLFKLLLTLSCQDCIVMRRSKLLTLSLFSLGDGHPLTGSHSQTTCSLLAPKVLFEDLWPMINIQPL